MPARAIPSESDSDQAVIEQAIALLLNEQSVRLADDAFISSSEITVERRPLSGPDGERIPGRSLETPLHFRLWKQGEICLLEYVEAETFRELDGFACTSLMIQ